MAFGNISFAYVLFCILHFGQFVLALTVCGLYGVELDRARKAGVEGDGKWVRSMAFAFRREGSLTMC